MLQKVMDLLKGSYWKLDLSRVKLSEIEVDFLKAFFDVTVERLIDDLTGQEFSYLVLRKKFKFISNPYIN
jgi:hypothetical protein